MRKILFILFLFASVLINAQTTYYVAAAGGDNGNAGTSGEPWATLAYAVTQASATDTIYMQAGTHTIGTQVSVPVGISIRGAGETSIIHSDVTTAYEVALLLHSATQGTNGNQTISYLKFDGDETGWGAIIINARSNVRVHHCTFQDFFSTGTIFNATTSYSSFVTTFATGNKYYDNVSTNCSDYPTTDDGQGHVMFGGQDGIEIYNNTMTQTTRATRRNGYLIKFYSYGYSKAFKIYNNTLTRSTDSPEGVYYDFCIETWHTLGGAEIYDNTMTGGIDVGGAMNSSGADFSCLVKGDYDYGIWIHDNEIGYTDAIVNASTGIYLERNTDGAIIERNLFKKVFNGIMISPSADETVENHRISYNIFNDIGYYGIRFINGATGAIVDSVDILNNIFYSPSATSNLIGIGLLSVGTTTYLNVQNNIIQGFDYAPMFANGASGQTMDYIKIQNNVMYGNANSNLPLFSDLTPTHYTNSDNVIEDSNFTTPGSNFILQAGSPAIDVGLDVDLTLDYRKYTVPYNVLVDIGAYEYGSSLAVVDSSLHNILTFVLAAQTGAATIDTADHTVAIEVEHGTDVTALSPTITLSYGATINSPSGTERDFTSPVTYTVTALDATTQEWTVTVTEGEGLNPPTVYTTTPTTTVYTTFGGITSGESITDRGFAWDTSENPTISGSHAHAGTGEGSFTYYVTSLKSGTTYHVRAFAINSGGTVYGADVEFTTPAQMVIINSGKALIYNGKIIIVK